MIRVFNQYVSLKTLLLVAVEGAVITLSLLAAMKLRFWSDAHAFQLYTQLPQFALQCLVVMVAAQVCFYYNDLYDPIAVRGRIEQVFRLGQSLGVAFLFLVFLYYLFPGLLIGRGVVLIGASLTCLAIMPARIAVDLVWPVTGPRLNVLILGAGELASNLARELNRRNDLNLSLVGCVARAPNGSAPESLFGCPIVGVAEDLEKVVQRHRVAKILVALEDRRGAMPVRELVRLRVQGVQIEDAHTMMAALTGRVWLGTVKPSWFIFEEGFRRSWLTALLKRTGDLAFALIGLILSAPVMAAVALAVRLDSPGPILYRQARVGYKGRLFQVLKFRSMRVDAERGGAQWASTNDSRVTRVGKHLRKFRLDELPQFINVIRGDMSFVGPRPERPEFVDQLREQIPYYDERHSMRPGVTGWAQVQYPYGASIEDAFRKLEYDLFYLQNLSFPFDCMIILATVRTVLFGGGAR